VALRLLLISALVAAVGALGCRGDGARPGELHGMVLPAPIPKADFTLPDTEGAPFALVPETEGYVTLLFFGYTYCPDICPVHMANIAAVLHRLPPQVSNRVRVVMVTVDPERDTPERLRQWLDNFDRSFVGLVGPMDEVNEIQRSLMLPAAVKLGDDETDYLMGHAAQVIAFTTDNRAHVMYPSGTRQTDWAHDLPLLVRGDWGAR
jgi:protein SCO1/2